MEALTQYLIENAIKATLIFWLKLNQAVNWFLHIFVKTLLMRVMYDCEKAYKKYVLKEKVWLFDMYPEEWSNFLKQYSWQIVEGVSYVKLSEKYVKPTGQEFASTPVKRIIYAKKL